LAAAELQSYVAKISAARLPIRAEPSVDVPVQIYVGESPHAAKLGVTADRLEHGACCGLAVNHVLRQNSGRFARLIIDSEKSSTS
jgi:hypothetical protein